MIASTLKEIDDRIQNIGVNGTVATHPEVCEILEAFAHRIGRLEARVQELEYLPRPNDIDL